MQRFSKKYACTWEVTALRDICRNWKNFRQNIKLQVSFWNCYLSFYSLEFFFRYHFLGITFLSKHLFFHFIETCRIRARNKRSLNAFLFQIIHYMTLTVKLKYALNIMVNKCYSSLEFEKFKKSFFLKCNLKI